MSKWMKVTKLLTAVVLIGFFAGTAMAKDSNEPNKPKHKMRAQERPMAAKDPAEQRLASLTKQLDLTADQQKAIKPILESQFSQMKTLREDKAIEPEQKRVKMQAIHQEANSKIEAQLTASQKEKFVKQQEERKEKMKERMKDPNRPGRDERARHKPHDSNSK